MKYGSWFSIARVTVTAKELCQKAGFGKGKELGVRVTSILKILLTDQSERLVFSLVSFQLDIEFFTLLIGLQAPLLPFQ